VNQCYDDWEHIIVDDGSTDNSVEEIHKYIKNHSGYITLIEQENKGQTAALNVAMGHATGDIIGWINSDDFYCENVFEKVLAVFEKYPKTDAVFGNFNVVDINGNYIYTKRHFGFNPVESIFLGFGNTLTSNCLFWRKSLSDKVGLFDEKLKCNMDGEYFSRLTYKANLYFLDLPIANFRKQEVSMAGKNNTNWNEIVKQEVHLEKALSYNRLPISRLIPFKYGKQIRYYFLMVRFIKKILRLDYYAIYRSKKAYKHRQAKHVV
jgi:glycosyltransferase involved in cell wall biosynthesis